MFDRIIDVINFVLIAGLAVPATIYFTGVLEGGF